jgi:tetratricopeptide (TPR) repeat protein
MWVYNADLANLPYPVAIPLSRTRRAISRDVPDKALLALISTVEEALRFTSVIILATTIVSERQLERPVIELMQKKRSLGDRCQLLIKLIENHGHDAPLDIDKFVDRKCRAELSRNLGVITNMRNRLAHEPPRSSDAHRVPLTTLLEAAEAFEPVIAWLQGTRLVSVFQPPSPGSSAVTVLPWMGQIPGVDDESLLLAPGTDTVAARPGQVLICVNNANIALSPFLVVRDDPARDQAEMHMIERLITRSDGVGAEWINLTSSDRPTPSGADEELELGRAMLATWLPLSPAPAKRRPDMARYLFGTTPLLIDRLLSKYVDRTDVPEAIDSLLKSSPSGSLWLVAGPGAGKSSVLAAVVQRYQAINHFVSRSEGRNNQSAILRSLIAQILTHMDAEELPEANDDLLPQQLANLLARQALRPTTPDPLIIVLDALDELGDDEAISRFLRVLPQELPSGAYIVMSSRPLPPGIAVPAGAAKFELKPLSIRDIRNVALKHGLPADPKSCETAFVASRGNPLFAVWALTLLRDHPGSALSVGDGFEHIISPILAGPMMSDRADDLAQVLAVLAIAQRPLDLSSLSTVTGLRRVRTLAAIDCVSAVLSITGGEVALGHQVVREYLLDPRSIYGLDASDVLSAHRSLARLAESDLAAYPAWLIPWHAVRAEDPGMIASLLSRGQYDEAVSRSLVELATTDIEAAKRVVNWLPSESAGIAVDVVGRLCEMRMPIAAESILGLAWADQINDVDRAVLEINLAVAKENVSQAIRLARTIYPKLAESAVSSIQASKVALLLGDGLRVEGHFEEALRLFSEALVKAPAGSTDEFLASFQIADIDFVCGRISKAEERLNELLSLSRIQGNVFDEVRVLRELGHLPLAKNEGPRAAQMYSDALDLALATGRVGMLAECYVSLAESLATIDPQRAIDNAIAGAEHAMQANAPREAGKSFYVRSEAYLFLKEIDKSLDSALTALRMLTESTYGAGVARAHLAASKALIELGQFNEALEHALKAYDYYQRERIYPQHWAVAITLIRRAYDALGMTAEPSSIYSIAELPNVAEYPQLNQRNSTSDQKSR